MARYSKEHEIESGILSIKTAAEFTGRSNETIKRLCNSGVINGCNVSLTKGRKEWRIPAVCLLQYCLDGNFPIHKKLLKAVANYRKNFIQEPKLKQES